MANQHHGERYQDRTADHHGLQPQSSPANPGDSSIHHLEEKIQDPGIYRNGTCRNKGCFEVGGYRGTSFCRECYPKFQQEMNRSDRAHTENSQVNRPSIPSVSAASQLRQNTSPLFTGPDPRSGVTSPPPSYSTLPPQIHPSPYTGREWQAPPRSLPATSPHQEHPREPMGGRYSSAPPVAGEVRPTSAQPIKGKRMGERREVKVGGGGDSSWLASSARGRQDRAGSRLPSHVQSQAQRDIRQDQFSAAYQGYPAKDPGERKLCQNLYCYNIAYPDCGGFCYPCFWIQHQGRKTGPREGHSMHGSSATSAGTAGRWPAYASRNLPTTAHRQDNITVTSDPPTPVYVDVHNNTFTLNTYIHPSAFTPSMWALNPAVVPPAVRSIIPGPAIQAPPTEQFARFQSIGGSELETSEERVFSGREKEFLSWNTDKIGREDYV